MSHREERQDKTGSVAARLLRSALQSRSRAGSDNVDRYNAEDVNPGENTLSYMQERFWFLQQLDPNGYHDNISLLLHLQGVLDHEILERTLRKVQSRHSILRTVFPAEDGKPTTHVKADSDLTLQIVSLTNVVSATRAWENEPVREIIREAIKRPFDLTLGPLWKAVLVQVGSDDNLLLIVMHHVIGDGSSWAVFLHELAEIYTANVNGEELMLPEPAMQYGDFARQQRADMRRGKIARDLAYWKNQLDGSERLQLTTDFPRQAIKTYRAGEVSLALAKSLREDLHELGHTEGASFFMILLAAFQLLMSRYTGQKDVTVGTPVAGRLTAATETMLGCFINTLAMRTDLSGEPTFTELLGRVRTMALQAYTHQDLPFELLLTEIQAERQLNQSPILNVFINALTIPASSYNLPGLTIRVLPKLRVSAHFDFTLYIREYQSKVSHGGSVELSLIYNKDLFTDQRMQELLRQFEHLLTQISVDPHKVIGEYSLVTSRSRHILPNPKEPLQEPQFPLVTELIETWAKNTPDAAAVEMGGHTWTYEQLWHAAQLVASALQSSGSKSGDVIAVQGKKCFGLIAAMTGVMAVGCVLLTIDPNLPPARQQLIVQQANASRWVRTDDSDEAFACADIPILIIDTLTGVPIDGANVLEISPLPELNGNDPAYIFFTSGTSGVPKGILGNHKGLAHFLHWQREQFKVKTRDRACQLIGIGFDVVLRDVFLSLISGATLVLPEDERLIAGQIFGWFKEKRISIIHTVPAVARSWLSTVTTDDVNGYRLEHLRLIFFSGEPLNGSLVRQWREIAGKKGEVVNLYGPTESTMVKTCYVVPQNVTPRVQSIGHALPNAQALILSNGSLCGVGEPGEIVIRTPFLTYGYINAPLEQWKFARNPFRNDESDRLYYTGDIGQYLPDGSLEILGRLDDQIKIRGVRIELGEIEAVLEEQPQVDQAVVIARQSKEEKMLVAYVTGAKSADVRALRRFIALRLPAALVPSFIIQLDEMPRSANGKVDRRQLASQDLPANDASRIINLPESDDELALAKIWEELLGMKEIDRHTSFFELGGHSLLAAQLVARISSVFEAEVPLRMLFEKPTVAELAPELAALVGSRDDRRQRLEAMLARINELPLEERTALLNSMKNDSRVESSHER